MVYFHTMRIKSNRAWTLVSGCWIYTFLMSDNHYLSFPARTRGQKKSQCLRIRGLGCGDNSSWRIRSLCRDHSCRYPVQNCPNNSVFPSVSECVFSKALPFGRGLVRRHGRCQLRTGPTFQRRHSSGGILRRVPLPYTTPTQAKALFQEGRKPLLASSLLIAMVTQTAGWQPCCWRWKTPHLSTAPALAPHQSSPSRAQAVLSAPCKQDQGSGPGDGSVSGSLSRHQHWRRFPRGWIIPSKSQRGPRDGCLRRGRSLSLTAASEDMTSSTHTSGKCLFSDYCHAAFIPG